MYEIETEEAVLGSILISDHEDQQTMLKELTIEMFYDPAHQILYQNIKTLTEKSVADVVTLPEHLRSLDLLHQVGGMEYVLQISSGVSSIANYSYYVDRLKKCHTQRLMTKLGKDILSQAAAGNVLECFNLAKTIQESVSIRDNMIKFNEVWLTHCNSNLPKDPLFKTGIANIDNTCEIHRKRLVMIAARPKTGKTTLACNIMANIPRNLKTLFFSMEMDAAAVSSWITAIISGRERTFVYKSPKSITHVQDLNIYIDDTGKHNIDEIEVQIAKHRPDVVFVDNLQKFNPGKEAKRDSYATLLCSMQDIAKKYNLVFFILVQINREIEKQKRSKPLLSDLKDTGAAEEQADLTLGLYEEHEKTMCTVMKNRYGPDGSTYELWFNKVTGKIM